MWIFGIKGESGFGASSTAEDVTKGIDGTGLTAIVTGASSGIGTETARVLALHGVLVVMAVRNTETGRKVKESILTETPDAKVDVMELDLTSLASVRKFASEYKSLRLPLNIPIYFIKTIPQGAATTCYGVSGEYFLDCNKAKPSSRTKDPELARKLWDFSLSMAAPSE